jgi:hypothetical protein
MVLDEGKADTACLGVRSTDWLPLHVIGNRRWLQVFLSKEDHLASGTYSKVIEIKERYTRVGEEFPIVHLNIKAEQGSTLFTDGSWANTASLGNQFIGNNNFRAGGAVVERRADGTWAGYYTTSDQGMYISAFDMELMMLLVAIDMRTDNQVIRSDCKSAIDVAKDGIWGWKGKCGNVLRAAAARLKNITNITHIAAHPERIKDRNCWEKWTEDERGIYLADLLAGGNCRKFWELTNTAPILLSSTDILKMCAVTAGYCLYWDNGNGPEPFFGSLSELVDHQNLIKYTKEREAHHEKNEVGRAKKRAKNSKGKRDPGVDAFRKRNWSEATVMTAASFLTKNKESKAEHAAEVRIMWDKAMSGANYFRYNICSWEEGICKFCQGKLETLDHKITECKEEHCVDIRNKAFQEFEDKMLALSKTKFERTVTAMRLYLDIFKEVNSGSAWLGLWFGEQASRIRNAIDSVSLNIRDFRMLKNAVKKLSAEAIKIVRAHDEAVVYNEIMNEQTPGLDPEVFQTRMNIELSRGELQRRLNMKTRYKKRKIGKDLKS